MEALVEAIIFLLRDTSMKEVYILCTCQAVMEVKSKLPLK